MGISICIGATDGRPHELLKRWWVSVTELLDNSTTEPAQPLYIGGDLEEISDPVIEEY